MSMQHMRLEDEHAMRGKRQLTAKELEDQYGRVDKLQEEQLEKKVY